MYRVRYSPELLNKLVPAVKDLSASDRIGLVDDAFALATAGKTATTDVLNLLLAFREETDYTVPTPYNDSLTADDFAIDFCIAIHLCSLAANQGNVWSRCGARSLLDWADAHH